MNLVNTYWKHHYESTGYRVVGRVITKKSCSPHYLIEWGFDELNRNSPGIGRSKVIPSKAIITDIQITEDEYLLNLIK
jgi:hypothetical protein